jgi:ribonuclease HI
MSSTHPIHLYTDGGSRGNPGASGIGIIVFEGEKIVLEHSEFLGTKTNNWAEYQGLIRGLEEVARHYGAQTKTRQVVVHMDSELIVKQMNGVYRVKDESLKKQHALVRSRITASFPNISFVHVRREKNKEADRLANEAMDRGK